MIQSKTILTSLPKVLKTIDLPQLGKKYQGKVRDFYVLEDKRLTITTDRQSAFDVILGYIPFKGAVLNQLAAFWFEKTKHIVPNHVISLPDPNVLISKNCKPIPVEMVIRNYLSGVTTTSIWHSYKKGERKMYGLTLPDGMKKNQKLPHPIITPSTHPEVGSNLHDERLTRQQIIDNKIVPEKLYEQMEDITYALFDFGSKWCLQHGFILVDTKYEFGIYDGKLMLMDELHTPDSARFWIKKTYEKKFSAGEEPENFDKEFLRIWYADKGYTGNGKPPKMTNDFIVEVTKRYIQAYEKITGENFNAFKYPIEDRIKQNLRKAGVLS
jgi:phosphoribosylaminoimidazole-succinocarboxamide synthase